MSAVFLDTVGLLALWDEADQWHSLAEAAFSRITKLGHSLVTTTFVLLECGNAAARRPYRAEANMLRQTLEQRGELIVPMPMIGLWHGRLFTEENAPRPELWITFLSLSCDDWE
jgi:hypothetical protein